LTLRPKDSIEDVVKVEEKKRENMLNEMLDEDNDLTNITAQDVQIPQNLLNRK
jgi:hypothetical protein